MYLDANNTKAALVQQSTGYRLDESDNSWQNRHQLRPDEERS